MIEGNGTILVCVKDPSGGAIRGATVKITGPQTFHRITDKKGECSVDVPAGPYEVTVQQEGFPLQRKNTTVVAGETQEVNFSLGAEEPVFPGVPPRDSVATNIESIALGVGRIDQKLPPPGRPTPVTLQRTPKARSSDLPLWVVIRRATQALSFENYQRFMDLVLCRKEPKKEEAERFDLMDDRYGHLAGRRYLPYNDVDAYRFLKIASEAFLMVNCGVMRPNLSFSQEEVDEVNTKVKIDPALAGGDLDALWRNYLQTVNGCPDSMIPYLKVVADKLKASGFKSSVFAALDERIDVPEDCVGILRVKLSNPCLLELIWSYWHEEGGLVQSCNAISRRFQNKRGMGDRDPLAELEIDPLRPLSNLLWGYIQDEQHRLSVVRRAYEYEHHYGLRLVGKAITEIRPADSRSKFLEAFHNLLQICTAFYLQDDDTTVVADGFPVLNALKEVHLLLSQGAHNQFGDLPSTARIEMLMQQWLLARDEFREFLPSRAMVAYPEPWMDRVDAMKKLQGWTDVSSLHFRNLGVFGEQILLGIRYGDWNNVIEPDQAANWARYWRAEIQGYTHAYRTVTGVDLTAQTAGAERYVQPSLHLRKRLASR